MIRLATLFSGIGAPEFAMRRLGVKYQTVLACDNGDVPLDSNLNLAQIKKAIFEMRTFEEEKRFVDELYLEHSRKHNFVKDTYLLNYAKKEPDLESRYFLNVALLNGLPLRDKVDLLIGGSPCQSFSTVGFQKGFDDSRGNLFFEFCRLVDEIKPKVFIYENVNGIRGSKKNRDSGVWKTMSERFEKLHYKLWMDTLNAKDYGIPQIRNRIFVVGFLDEEKGRLFQSPSPKTPCPYTMQDFLISSTKEGEFTFLKRGPNKGDIVLSRNPGDEQERYILTPAVKKYVLTPGTKNWKTKIETDRTIARTLLSTMRNHHRAGVDNYVTTSKGELRALSPRECLRLMGFTDDFEMNVSIPRQYSQIGNSMVVDVVMALLKSILATNPF